MQCFSQFEKYIYRVKKYVIKVNRFNWTCIYSGQPMKYAPDQSSEEYPDRRNSVSSRQVKDMDCVHLCRIVQKMGADGAHLKDIIAQ